MVNLTTPTATNSAIRLAYILSASHSGSTLLAMLLGSQPEACTVGELRAPSIDQAEEYRCSCGERIRDCRFWNAVSESMARQGIPGFDICRAGTSIHELADPYAAKLLNPLHRGPLLEMARDLALAFSGAWKAHLPAAQARNAALVRSLAETTGAKIIIDSSKAVLHLKYLLRNPALDIKVLCLVRDGRAVSVSLLGHGLKRANRQETIAAAAREWRRSNEAADCLLRRLPASRWMQVKYEELCQAPAAVLRRVCGFLDLAADQVTLDFRAREQHVLGNEMRLKSGSAIRLDERWRAELSATDLAVFDKVAGDLNRRYGYV